MISNVLGLSENLAGVTLLAFGNGSPDIFTAVANPDGDTEMMFAELVGAACFIIGVIGGTIIIIHPFKTNGYNFMRDVLFFMISILFLSHAMEDMIVYLWEAILFLLIYVLYLIVVIGEHFVLRNRARLTDDGDVMSIETDVDSNISRDNQFLQLLISLNPIDVKEWREDKAIGKLVSVIKAPGLLALSLLIPIVDYEQPNHGWSKLLNVIHCFTLPQFILFVTETGSNVIFNVPLYYIAFVMSLLIGIVVFFNSSPGTPPKYHIVFACMSFVGSVLVIYICASEVVSILETLGVISGLSHSFLGLSVLAWGNSIGDLISNITLARKGYTQMAFAACFGGPMFSNFPLKLEFDYYCNEYFFCIRLFSWNWTDIFDQIVETR